MFQAAKKGASFPDWLRVLAMGQQPRMDSRPGMLPPGFDPNQVPEAQPMPGTPGRMPAGPLPQGDPSAMQQGPLSPEVIEYLQRLMQRGQ